jgi:carboxylesterase
LPGAEPFLYKSGEVGCLLLHGYTSSPFEMRGLGRYLADRGITAGAPLLAGHGTVPEDLTGKTWRDWYASANAALDDMLAQCKRVYLAGLSLGGALTLYTALHRGKDLAGIIAMSAPIYLPPPLGIVLKGLQTSIPYVSKPFSDIEDPDARVQHISYDRSPVACIASLVEFLAHVRGALPQVKVPSLIIYARHDHVVPCVSSHYIYSRLGTTRKQMIALHRGFHIVTVDTDREKVYSAIHNFINDCDSRY